MSSLDELVDQLLQEHAAKQAPDAQPAPQSTPQSPGVAAGDSLEGLLKSAGDSLAAQELQELTAELSQLRLELDKARRQSEALQQENSALKEGSSGGGSAAQGAQPVSEVDEIGALFSAPAQAPSGSSAAFPWKRHIGVVEAALRGKEMPVAEPVIKVLIDVAEVVGAENAVRVRLMTQLGTIQIERKQYAEADSVLTKAVSLVETVGSPTQAEQLAHAFCLDALAQSHLEQEDFDAAEKLRRKAVVLADDSVGAEHPDSGYFRERLETLREARQTANIGKDDASKTLYDKLSEEYNASGGEQAAAEEKPADSYTGFMFEKFLNMAKTALAQKNAFEAESNLRTAMTKADGVANSNPRKSEAMRMLAHILEGQNKDAQARELYEQALTLAFHRSWRDIEVAQCLAVLAEVTCRLNDIGVAKNYYSQAIGLYTTISGADDATTQALQAKYKEFLERVKEERQWKGWSQ